MTDFSSLLEAVILTLPELRDFHARTTKTYAFLKQACRREIEDRFGDGKFQPQEFSPFGELSFPYYKMGAIDSLNLFDLDELIIFSYYWASRSRYKRVADVGANIGLHSVILNKCGFQVRSYEPDPLHFGILQDNLSRNNCAGVEAFNTAISSKAGKMEFIRVLGNTTGSHLAGSKSNPYGELEKFPVNVEAVNSILKWADLIKLDAEGHEKEILLSTKRQDWLSTDALVEVENEVNARALYEHFRSLGINLFSQKNNWHIVDDFKTMPNSYREGTLFVTSKKEMFW